MFRQVIIPVLKNSRSFSVDAKQLFNNSCYSKVDYKINESEPVYNAVIKFSAFDIGCVAVTNNEKQLMGIFSEGDFIKRVASVDKDPKKVIIRDVCTLVPNVLVASSSDTLEECLSKMHVKKIRHLAIVDGNDLNGLISIKDIFSETIKQDRELITRLSNFYLGKGAFFGSE